MAATPEGFVKAKVRKILAHYPDIYTYWPVPSGFGKTTLDVLGCYRGKFFTIETKAAGKKPTLRQAEEIKNIETAMGKAFVLSGVDDPEFEYLVAWLNETTKAIAYDPDISPDQVRRRPL